MGELCVKQREGEKDKYRDTDRQRDRKTEIQGQRKTDIKKEKGSNSYLLEEERLKNEKAHLHHTSWRLETGLRVLKHSVGCSVQGSEYGMCLQGAF